MKKIWTWLSKDSKFGAVSHGAKLLAKSNEQKSITNWSYSLLLMFAKFFGQNFYWGIQICKEMTQHNGKLFKETF
jgi:hypothetical protein